MIISHFFLTNRFQSPQLGLNVGNSILHLITVRYRPGKDNPTDYMSRYPLGNQSARGSNTAIEHVNFIAEHAIPVALSLQEIEEATLNDKVLQEVIKCMASNNWPKSV